MTSGKLLRQLIKSGADGNLGDFKKASEEVIREEREKQHHLLANDLEENRGTDLGSSKGDSRS